MPTPLENQQNALIEDRRNDQKSSEDGASGSLDLHYKWRATHTPLTQHLTDWVSSQGSQACIVWNRHIPEYIHFVKRYLCSVLRDKDPPMHSRSSTDRPSYRCCCSYPMYLSTGRDQCCWHPHHAHADISVLTSAIQGPATLPIKQIDTESISFCVAPFSHFLANRSL